MKLARSEGGCKPEREPERQHRVAQRGHHDRFPRPPAGVMKHGAEALGPRRRGGDAEHVDLGELRVVEQCRQGLRLGDQDEGGEDPPRCLPGERDTLTDAQPRDALDQTALRLFADCRRRAGVTADTEQVAPAEARQGIPGERARTGRVADDGGERAPQAKQPAARGQPFDQSPGTVWRAQQPEQVPLGQLVPPVDRGERGSSGERRCTGHLLMVKERVC